jgi:hypothetical protein
MPDCPSALTRVSRWPPARHLDARTRTLASQRTGAGARVPHWPRVDEVHALSTRSNAAALGRRACPSEWNNTMQTVDESVSAAHPTDAKTYTGSCFCGAVQLTVTGAPAAMGYCHCESCRSWSAGPVNAFTLWKPEAVQVTRGAANIGSFNKTPNSARKWCNTCGGHLYTAHPGMGLTDVYAAVIPDFPFEPGAHVNYQETMLRIADGLPKLKDLPGEMGGSGVVVPE